MGSDLQYLLRHLHPGHGSVSYTHLDVYKRQTITRTHQNIADELGTAREVVSRQLKRLEQKGAVSLGRGHVEITDRKTLEKMANV